MMTQADILAKNQDMYTDLSSFNSKNQNQSSDSSTESSNRAVKPTNFGGAEFPEINSLNLTENSPIRPSKYFATDSAINTSKGLRNIIIGGVTFSLVVTLALIIQIMIGTTQLPNRVGIVTQEKVCTEIGADMVRYGGNSIDAFIASSFCLGVVNPFVAGLGAGGYLLIRDHKHEKDYSLNCFFKSSAILDIKSYTESPGTGIKSIAIPGEFKCLQTVYHKYARFYWKTLTAPAIKLAREGFNVSNLLAQHLADLDIEKDIKTNPVLAEMFLDSNGDLVKEASLIKNPRLATTLDLLSKTESLFYDDGIIDVTEMLDENNKQQITLSDLKSYAAQDNVLITAIYNDFVLMTTSFPSIGPTLKYIIDLLSQFTTTVSDFKNPEVYQRILEASKLGYLLSSHISDPNYGAEQTELFNEKLTLAKKYLQGFNTTYPFNQSNIKLKDDLAINFISVNDHNDLMVSYVGTLGSAWGSKHLTKTGFFLNNGLNLFSYGSENENQNFVNSIGPNKQPRGLMAPILAYNKNNPCIRRFSISYGHHSFHSDDYALSELTQVILKIFTDFSLYETSLNDKRLQYSTDLNGSGVCFEDGFDLKTKETIEKENGFKQSNSCMFHSIDLVMKKDHVIYGKADITRSNDSLTLVN